MKNKNKLNEEVYTSTGLSDLLSSPVFYAVLVLTFVLGLSSVFGFLEDPRKLKVIADVISEKVSVLDRVNTGFSINQPASYLAKHRYNILSKELFPSKADRFMRQGLQKVSFNYDITAKDFWSNLDSSFLDSAEEESDRDNINGLKVGVPLSPDYYSVEDDSKYTLKVTGILRKS